LEKGKALFKQLIDAVIFLVVNSEGFEHLPVHPKALSLQETIWKNRMS
jgi:hypothetical protein